MAKLYASKSPEVSQRELDNMDHVRKIASQGMVLLKNESVLPFKGVKTIAAFGGGVRRTVKGGTGSGDVNSRMVINIEQGLTDAGFRLTSTAWLDQHDQNCAAALEAYNEEIRKTADGRNNVIMAIISNPYRDPDVPEIIEADLVQKADACLYVISRNSGEGADRHPVSGDYELTEGEKQNLETLCKVYDKIAVILNVGGVIDTKFLRSCPQVAAILNMSQAGNISGHVLADVLTGKVTPSGHLTTTWAENYKDYANAETFSHMNGNTDEEYYTDGIYVGYRYFDTFDITPAYPFGFGLSYTQFDVKADSVKIDDANVVVEATVKNIGSEYSGKEVVQVYCSAPMVGIEKPYQELVAYVKTKELAPDASQKLTLCFPITSLASYCEKCASYVMESGMYYIRLGSHSRNTHIAAALKLGERTVISVLKNKVVCNVELEQLSNKGTTPYTYVGEEAEKSNVPVITLDPKSIPCETITYSGEPEEMTTDKDYTVTLEDVIAGKADLKDLVAQLTVEEMAILTVGTARKGSIGAGSAIGTASNVVPGAAGDTTSTLMESRAVPNMVLADGPAGLRLSAHFVADKDGSPIEGLGDSGFEALGALMSSGPKPERSAGAVDYYQYCTAIPIATLLAQTWDLDVIEEAGDIVGGEMELFGINLWLAPGMNIHRNPLCGRNFEYYSEDPLVTGLCAAAETRGVQKHPGCGATIKHFCMNNSEENRYSLNCHASERAIREIYLRGFEIAVKTTQPLSLMSSYNLVNDEHAANKYDTLTAILRDEWGFNGFVMTDWGTTGMGDPNPGQKYPFSDAAGCIKAGNDLTEPGNEEDVATIIRSVDAKEGDEGVRYPISKAELQLCAYRILKIVVKCVADPRSA